MLEKMENHVKTPLKKKILVPHRLVGGWGFLVNHPRSLVGFSPQ